MEQSAELHRKDGYQSARASLGASLLLVLAGCASVTGPIPNAQTVAGMTPAGSVQITETFAAGVAAGGGTLQFQGQSYPFRLVGAIVGPGLAADRIRAEGPVYNLAQLSDFPGAYRQSTGHSGLSSSQGSDLWLENKAGVIMHLTGTQQGGMLSLGRDEIVIRMEQ